MRASAQLHDDRNVDVHRSRSPRSRIMSTHAASRRDRVGAFPAGVRIGKMFPEIAERARAEQRIGERVREYVGIGMSERTAFEGHAHAA